MRTEIFDWLALIFMRAIATNFGDLTVYGLRVDIGAATLVFGVATLAVGAFAAPSNNGATPNIDLRYWAAMFLGGVFGTAGGDLVAHALGVLAAGAALGLALLAVIAARARLAPTAMLGYWAIVLAERAAGTPLGDVLAERHGFALGLPAAMAITGGMLATALTLRRTGR